MFSRRRPMASLTASLLFALTLVGACASTSAAPEPAAPPPAAVAAAAPAPAPRADLRRPHVIIDSDANNELDDQHAIAYLLLDRDAWRVEAVTTNRTKGGGGIEKHTEEARRVVALCARPDVKVLPGADGSFLEIKDHVQSPEFDGHEAVDFFIARARERSPSDKLILIPVGKLTNVALALLKAPAIAPNVRVMWLGSNWPKDTKEYNEANDLEAVNYVMDSGVELDIALVRYGVRGPESGTAAVTVSTDEIRKRMPGLGPKVREVAGRHGGSFTSFGDYSIELFEKIGSRERALFDMAAVAIVKNPAWAQPEIVPAPQIVDKQWKARPDNPRRVRFYKNFDRDAIIADFYTVLTRAGGAASSAARLSGN